MADKIEVLELYVDGDAQSGSIVSECPEPKWGLVGVHVLPTNGDGSPDGTPYTSTYLTPIDAALFGAQVIAAARAAMPEVPDA